MIEIRTSDPAKFDRLAGLCGEMRAGMGIGSECCVHRLPSVEQVEAVAGQIDGLTVVTPITPQKHYEWMLGFIRSLPAGIRLVVNDVGVLYALHREGGLEDFCAVVAGRGIVHTSEACPWVDHLIRDEFEDVKAAFLQTNLNYSRTLEFMKGMGISAMETDLESRTIRAARTTGLPVGAHAEYIVVSYARSCHTARFFGERPPHCVQRCNNPMELELVDMFDLSGTPPGFAQPSPQMLEIFPTLHLLGNTVYFKSDCKDTTGLERVILNAQMYTDDALKQAIGTFEDK
ncbi:MAG: hypothetical protein M8349_06285 [ANME-2 cluster archaeon]|nr:hypothetical protein [ANME-2 cluster archaeon]